MTLAAICLTVYAESDLCIPFFAESLERVRLQTSDNLPNSYIKDPKPSDNKNDMFENPTKMYLS